jgi:REP element-mobilizing transposase RayT
MPNYRRVWMPGATFFFTVNLRDRRGDLHVRHVDLMRHSVRVVKEKHPFEAIPWVVLPDHMHAIWALPLNDADYSLRWRAIKSIFSRELPNTEGTTATRARRGELVGCVFNAPRATRAKRMSSIHVAVYRFGCVENAPYVTYGFRHKTKVNA